MDLPSVEGSESVSLPAGGQLKISKNFLTYVSVVILLDCRLSLLLKRLAWKRKNGNNVRGGGVASLVVFSVLLSFPDSEAVNFTILQNLSSTYSSYEL